MTLGQARFTSGWFSHVASVLVVLLAGFLVRRVGILHGQPDLIFHPDVSKQAAVAHAVYAGDMKLRELLPSRFEVTHYPYGSSVLAGNMYRLIEPPSPQEGGRTVVRWGWAVRLRYFSVAIFLAAVGLLLLVRNRHAGVVPTLLTGLLLVLEPLNVQHSHYGMNDVPLVSLLLLAWLSAGAVEKERAAAPIGSLLTGLLLGVAFGVKYQAALGGVFLLVAWMGVWRRKRLRGLLASACTAGAGLAAGLWLTMPLLVQSPEYFFSELPKFLAWQSNILGEPLPLAEKALRNLRTLSELLGSSLHWVLFVGLAVGILRGAGSPGPSSLLRRQRLSALLFCAALGAVLVGGRDFVRSNDVLPLLAFMTILFGDCLAAPQAGVGHPWRRRFCTAVAVVAIGVFSADSLRDSLALTRTDTRVLARDWCLAHLPSPSVILRDRYTLPIRREGVEEIEIRHFAQGSAQQLVSGVADFLVLSSLSNERYSDPASPYFNESAALRYRSLEHGWEQIAVFSDRRLIYAHPQIRVLRRLRPAAAPALP